MTTEQLMLVGVVGIAAYFIIKTQTVSAATFTPTYSPGNTTIPSGGIPTTPGQASATPTASGGGITYTNKNISVALGFDTIKNWFSDAYNAITGGEKPTITPANVLTSQIELNSMLYPTLY